MRVLTYLSHICFPLLPQNPTFIWLFHQTFRNQILGKYFNREFCIPIFNLRYCASGPWELRTFCITDLSSLDLLLPDLLLLDLLLPDLSLPNLLLQDFSLTDLLDLSLLAFQFWIFCNCRCTVPFKPLFWILDVLIRIWIRRSLPRIWILLFSSVTFKMPTKSKFFLQSLLLFFFLSEVYLHQSSKITS